MALIVRDSFVALTALLAAMPSGSIARAKAPRLPAPIVYFDVARPADAKLAVFYAKIFAGPPVLGVSSRYR